MENIRLRWYLEIESYFPKFYRLDLTARLFICLFFKLVSILNHWIVPSRVFVLENEISWQLQQQQFHDLDISLCEKQWQEVNMALIYFVQSGVNFTSTQQRSELFLYVKRSSFLVRCDTHWFIYCNLVWKLVWRESDKFYY